MVQSMLDDINFKTAKGNKKRRIPTSEFLGKFESKRDLLYYFKHNRR